MQYRDFGKTGIKVSALGFGTMRLPLLPDGRVDETEAVRIIRRAIDQGVNYIDTAYPYHDGESERIVGDALGDGYRERTYIATKCPVWDVEREEDFERILEDQLVKLKTDHIDFYLLHALNRERLREKVQRFSLIRHMEQAREQGKIRYLGFSFHDDLEAFKEIVSAYDGWDFCQIQHNYIDLENQGGTGALRFAAEKGLGVVIMEPLLGGKLANPSPHLAKVFPEDRTPVEYALDFLWDQKEVSLLLSGMSDAGQVEDNLVYADRSRVGMAKEGDRAVYQKAKQIFDSMALVGCTGCRYCMPCPFGLDIPAIFAAYNQTATHEKAAAVKLYEALEVKADACASCRHCEGECPQSIRVSEVMPEAAKAFAK